MDDLNRLVTKLTNFFGTEIWEIRVDDLPRHKGALVRLLRTIALSVRGFTRDNCILRASSLTFYSLLAVVPVAAMAFGIAKGFGFQKRLERQILEQIPGQEEVLIQIVESANRFLENTKGGLIAGIGVVVLFWSVIKVLSHIESAFNVIWGIDRSRTFGRKFADYLSIMLIGPVLVILSSSVTVYISTQITEITQKVALIGMFSELIFSMLKLLPYCLIWLLFTIMYMLMPNTRVRFGPGFLAGIVAGTAYQIAQWGYITFQIGTARYNAIYGSFAALPLFLIWLHVSWQIVLFGAEMSSAAQQVDAGILDRREKAPDPYVRQLVALTVVWKIVKNFAVGNPPLSSKALSSDTSLPLPWVRSILDELVESGCLTRINGTEPLAVAYQPGVDTDLITVNFVIESLQHRAGEKRFAEPDTHEWRVFSDTLQSFSDTLNKAEANKLLKEI